MSQPTSSIRESSRVFIGGLGVAALAWAYWNGYVFRPIAEPVAYAMAGPADGKVGGGEFADLMARMLTGALWLAGEIVWIALTVACRFTGFVFTALVKWLLSFTDAGKDLLQHWSDSKASRVSTAAEPAIESPATQIEQCVATINAVIPVVNRLALRSNKAKETIAALQSQLSEMESRLASLERSKEQADVLAELKKP
jgi:hypothetical protein